MLCEKCKKEWTDLMELLCSIFLKLPTNVGININCDKNPSIHCHCEEKKCGYCMPDKSFTYTLLIDKGYKFCPYCGRKL